MLVHLVVTLVLYLGSLLLLVAALGFVAWESVEKRVLRVTVAKKLSEEYGTKVTLKGLRIRRRGVQVEDLVVANDPAGTFGAPYFCRVARLDVKTADAAATLSLLGVVRLGGSSATRHFVLGFPVRDVSEVLVSDVRVFVDEDARNGVQNDAFLKRAETRQKLRESREYAREAKAQAEFKEKWRHSQDSAVAAEDDDDDDDEDDEEDTSVEKRHQAAQEDSVGSRLTQVAEALRTPATFSQRKENLLHLRDTFSKQDKAARAATKAAARRVREKAAERWRIGRIDVADVHFDFKGHAYHLENFEYRGFVGDTTKLKRTLVVAITPRLITDIKQQVAKNAKAAVASKVDAVKSKVAIARSRLASLAPPGRRGSLTAAAAAGTTTAAPGGGGGLDDLLPAPLPEEGEEDEVKVST